jgi:hypothetical protein
MGIIDLLAGHKMLTRAGQHIIWFKIRECVNKQQSCESSHNKYVCRNNYEILGIVVYFLFLLKIF